MSLKKKLFTTITMFALVLSMVLVGVWAISADTVSFGGTITFTATNILATISGEVSGTASDPKLDDLEYTSAGGPSADALNSWSNNLTFKEDGSAFSIEITIKNDSSRKIYWSIIDTVEANANISKTISTYTLGETNELAGNGTTTFTITIGLANGTNNSVSGSYGYQIDLKDESEYVPIVDITSGHDYLTFGTPANGVINVTGLKDSTVTEVVIPAKVILSGVTYDVRRIGDEAFMNCANITSVTLPISLWSIGDYAFYYCRNLTSITIPDSVTSIADFAFYGCSNIESIDVDANNTTYNDGNESDCIIEKSSSTLILGCKNTVIPNTVTAIGDYAFYDCSNLTSITIPDSVKAIGEKAFLECIVLQTVYVDSAVVINNYYSTCNNSYLFDYTTNVYIHESITVTNTNLFVNANEPKVGEYYRFTEYIYSASGGGSA